MRLALRRRSAIDGDGGGAGGHGGLAARRAVARWAWRLFRREWRQQVLVLALLAVAVAAAVGGMAVAYNSVSLRDAEFGTATQIYELDGADPEQARADLGAVREHFGTVEVIDHTEVPIPGSVETVDLRAQDPDGAYGRPMLALREGRYPRDDDEVALTDDVAATFEVDVGSQVDLDGVDRRVVGVVENPSDLDDEFALLDPAHAPPPEVLTLLLRTTPDRTQAFPVQESELGGRERGQTEKGAAAAGVLSAATLAMLLIALLAAAGFVVVAQRRLRQLGMLAAIGATERHLRLVVVSNGLAVGAMAALIGAAAALAAWIPLAPLLEPVVGHRIDRFDLPWATIAAGMALAVATATAAAWWPARAMARVPVVAALSARPPRPKPARRSALLGLVLVVGGAVSLDLGIDAKHDTGNGFLATTGLVLLVVGVLFVGPLAIRVLAAVGRRAPLAPRLAVRDLARYQARSGAALAAISLGLGIPAAIVVAASAGEHRPDEGNLAADQLLVRLDGDPSPDRAPEEVAELEAEVERIAGLLDDAAVLPLDVAIDPTYDPEDGPPFVRLARPVNENTNRDVATPYVATPELLDRYGIDRQAVDPDVDLVTVETGQLKLVNTGWYHTLDEPETVTRVQRIDAPAHSEAPTSLLTPGALTRRGWQPARIGWFVDTGAPVTDDQIRDVRELAVDVGLTVETRDTQDSLAMLRSGATAAGVLLALGILAMAVGLIRGETAGDLRTLTASGATSSTRRLLAAATTGSLAFLGVVLGTTGAYVGLIAGYAEALDNLGTVPYVHLLVLVIVLPLSAALAGWLLAGREPPTLSRTPLD